MLSVVPNTTSLTVNFSKAMASATLTSTANYLMTGGVSVTLATASASSVTLTLSAALTVFFFVRSWKDGYWNKEGEDIKFQVFEKKVKHGTDETED